MIQNNKTHVRLRWLWRLQCMWGDTLWSQCSLRHGLWVEGVLQRFRRMEWMRLLRRLCRMRGVRQWLSLLGTPSITASLTSSNINHILNFPDKSHQTDSGLQSETQYGEVWHRPTSTTSSISRNNYVTPIQAFNQRHNTEVWHRPTSSIHPPFPGQTTSHRFRPSIRDTIRVLASSNINHTSSISRTNYVTPIQAFNQKHNTEVWHRPTSTIHPPFPGQITSHRFRPSIRDTIRRCRMRVVYGLGSGCNPTALKTSTLFLPMHTALPVANQ